MSRSMRLAGSVIVILALWADTTVADETPELVAVAQRRITSHAPAILALCYPTVSFAGIGQWDYRPTSSGFITSAQFSYQTWGGASCWRRIVFELDQEGKLTNISDQPVGPEKDTVFTLTRRAKKVVSLVFEDFWPVKIFNKLLKILDVFDINTDPGHVFALLVNELLLSEQSPTDNQKKVEQPADTGAERAGTDPKKSIQGGPETKAKVEAKTDMKAEKKTEAKIKPKTEENTESPELDPPPKPKSFDDGPVAAANGGGRYCFGGPHPTAEGTWDSWETPHLHEYPPIDLRIFSQKGECYFFKSDPRDFGYGGATYNYFSAHPVPDEFGGGWCFMIGPHSHLWRPWSANFKVLGAWYYWDGDRDPAVQAYRPYYSFYYRNYYAAYYAGGRFYRTRQAAPPIALVPVANWRDYPTGAWPGVQRSQPRTNPYGGGGPDYRSSGSSGGGAFRPTAGMNRPTYPPTTPRFDGAHGSPQPTITGPAFRPLPNAGPTYRPPAPQPMNSGPVYRPLPNAGTNYPSPPPQPMNTSPVYRPLPNAGPTYHLPAPQTMNSGPVYRPVPQPPARGGTPTYRSQQPTGGGGPVYRPLPPVPAARPMGASPVYRPQPVARPTPAPRPESPRPARAGVRPQR
jgi:hypothetical protein